MIQPVKNRIADVYNELPQAPIQAIQGAIRTTQEAIEEHPGAAVMTAFAVGVGIGIGMAALLSCSASQQRSTWSPYGR